MSDAKAQRKGLEEMFPQIRDGDVVIRRKLNRQGRSSKHLIKQINDGTDRGIRLKSLNAPVETTTFQGRMITNDFASIANIGKDFIRERNHAGLKAALARVRTKGPSNGYPRKQKFVYFFGEN